MIITIDGPAGAGKSTVSKLLAARLGFRFLDTGAMYRAITLAALEKGLNLSDAKEIECLAKQLSIELRGDQVLLDGEDVSIKIRSQEVTTKTGQIADHLPVRKFLVQLQRQIAAGQNFVTEGRDQGTVVFPNAECKFFLVAGDEERAKRRLKDLVCQGETTKLKDILAQQQQRDASDCAREFGGLKKAEDAIEIVTDGLTLEEVVETLFQHVQSHLK